jgi:phage tail-like protein
MNHASTYWLLDSVAGWRSATAAGVSFTTPDGDVILDPLPGSATAIASSVKCPSGLAACASGRLYVVDSAVSTITVLDSSTCPQQPLRLTLSRPSAAVLLPGGELAVAEPANHRVLLFSGPPFALLRVFEVGKPETGRPCALAADGCGIIYVLDRATASVLRWCLSGKPLPPLGAGVLKKPVDIAAAKDGTLAVADSGEIVVFPPKNADPLHVKKATAPLCVSFDDTNNLFAGTADGLVAKLEPDVNELDGYRLGGEGVADPDSRVTHIVWTKNRGLVVILNNGAPRLAALNPSGAFALQGTFQTTPLDSGIEKCSWDRVQILGSLPRDTSLLIQTATAETADGDFNLLSQDILTSGDNPDCLVQNQPGRYLQLTLTLRSSGASSPRIHAIKVFFPRQSYLQYLPAVFQEDDESRLFLDRFLSIFQTSFDGFDRLIDNIWQYFDPFTVPAKFLPWLAAWVALPLDPGMPLPSKRALLASAFQNYLLRGTVAGLQQVIQAYTGVPDIRILEHFRLRQWPRLDRDSYLNQGARLFSRNFYARFQTGVNSTIGAFRLTNAPEPSSEPFDFGANKFSVMFPAHPYRVEAPKAAVQKIVDRERPAHTQAFVCPVFPRLRVGVQATLDVDAYTGSIDPMILCRVSTLGYDSVLACSPLERDVRAVGTSLQPRAGLDAAIL